ncbi:methyl-accepting chemotaxis protein [Pseudomonas sp. S31]|nr:methyl-accepting chemotaxis protein [Pseudomonas sp. S31]
MTRTRLTKPLNLAVGRCRSALAGDGTQTLREQKNGTDSFFIRKRQKISLSRFALFSFAEKVCLLHSGRAMSHAGLHGFQAEARNVPHLLIGILCCPA